MSSQSNFDPSIGRNRELQGQVRFFDPPASYQLKTVKIEQQGFTGRGFRATKQDVKPLIGLQRSKTIIKRNRAHHRKPMPRSREELLQCIGQDREVLGAYFQRLNQQKDDANSNGNGNARVADRVASTSATTASPQRNSVASTAATTPSPQRNSYDLFFESACITVKSLPAKLAAEAKSRISQIITEFEIRAISQQEEQQAAQMRRQKNFDDIGGGVEYEFHSCP